MPGNLKKQQKMSKQQRNSSSSSDSSSSVSSQIPLTATSSCSLPVLLITSAEYNANRDNLERLKLAGNINFKYFKKYPYAIQFS